MPDDEKGSVFALDLEDDGLEPLDNVLVRFAPRVPIAKLVGGSGIVFMGHCSSGFCVRHSVANARINLINRTPSAEGGTSQLGALHRFPHLPLPTIPSLPHPFLSPTRI